ncbi:hypothetical protein D9M72_501440 [compost metagenome]
MTLHPSWIRFSIRTTRTLFMPSSPAALRPESDFRCGTGCFGQTASIAGCPAVRSPCGIRTATSSSGSAFATISRIRCKQRLPCAVRPRSLRGRPRRPICRSFPLQSHTRSTSRWRRSPPTLTHACAGFRPSLRTSSAASAQQSASPWALRRPSRLSAASERFSNTSRSHGRSKT